MHICRLPPTLRAASVLLAAWTAWAAPLLAGLPQARAQEVIESATGQRFPTALTYHGKSYTLIGVGLRKKLMFKVYAMGLYVEQAGARQAFPSLVQKAGGRERSKLLADDRAQTFVSWGHFSKLGVLHFVRDVDKDKIQEAYRDSLHGYLTDKAAPDMSRDAQAFIALFDRDLKEGQDIRIHTEDNGKITVEVAGQQKAGPQNVPLCRAIWDIWLGQKTISRDMQRSLVERIDELGR